jgi:hypothetical protein
VSAEDLLTPLPVDIRSWLSQHLALDLNTHKFGGAGLSPLFASKMKINVSCIFILRPSKGWFNQVF